MAKKVMTLTLTQTTRIEKVEEDKNETEIAVIKKKPNFVKLIVRFLKSLWLGMSD